MLQADLPLKEKKNNNCHRGTPLAGETLSALMEEYERTGAAAVAAIAESSWIRPCDSIATVLF